MEVNRNNLLDDTFKAISKENVNLKMPIKVKFSGEAGDDAGGPRKEFFMLMTSQLFNTDFGMFVAKMDNKVVWFNPNYDDMPIYFELAGSVLGLSI